MSVSNLKKKFELELKMEMNIGERGSLLSDREWREIAETTKKKMNS